MASQEQLKLATFIKSVHKQLRERAKETDPKVVWLEHIENDEILQTYSDSMRKLATFWETNNTATEQSKPKRQKLVNQTFSRVQWTIENCQEYFQENLTKKRDKEDHLLKLWFNEDITKYENKLIQTETSLKILDVGSCYNPFKDVEKFNVTAIDLYPENNLNVYKCDFLNVKINNDSNSHPSSNDEIHSLPIENFDCIIFSLFLEYIPTSKQRVKCCENAYKLLKYEGILIVITPDSQNVGKNAKLMKNWRYTFAKLGFLRIKYEKLQHITCMIFRKSLDTKISNHWSDLHKEDYMNFSLEIPQDKECS